MFDFLLFVACECFRSTELLLQGKQLITIKQNNPLRQAFYFIIFFIFSLPLSFVDEV